MISCGLISRRIDGTDYWRIEQEPPVEAKALIQALNVRRGKGTDNTKGARHA